MKILTASLLSLLCIFSAHAADQILSQDDASDAVYKDGWKAGGGGNGFGPWVLLNASVSGSQSFAGNYIADTSGANADISGVAIGGKAFGLFANGVGFEVATAFRPLSKPLEVGQTFSFLMKHADFVKKFDQDDPGTGSVGITLRSGSAAASTDDYNKGARFEFGAYAGKPNYQIYDGESAQDTGVPASGSALTVSVTLVTPDTYDIEITTLPDKKQTTLKGRKLGGTAGGTIDGFCIFNRNGEKNDAFFNGFQITAAPAAPAAKP